MPGGRPVKPTKLKLLHGDDKKNPARINRAEPVPAALPVAPPGWLSAPALEVWHRLAPDRIDKGVLTAWDVDAFGLFCEALVIARRATARADQPAPVGGASPVREMQTAVAICSSLGGRFGWTPADRAKLVSADVARDPTADLLSG